MTASSVQKAYTQPRGEHRVQVKQTPSCSSYESKVLPPRTLKNISGTRVILKVFSVMFSARTAFDYREQCFGGQAQSLIAARC